MMNTTINTTTTRASDKTTALLSVLGVALLGLTLVFSAGLAQSATLHDAAHDVRHATGFPCH
jgi:cobalt transporter subunit CbtB